LGECVHAVLLANGVEGHDVVSLLLELLVKHLPLLLQGADQLLSLSFRHQEFLSIALVLFLNLHFTHQVVLVLDLVLDLGHVLGHGAVVLLLKVILLGVLGELGGSEDVLDSVRNDEVLVGNEAVDGFLVTLGNCGLSFGATGEFGDLLLVDEDGVASLLLGEVVGVGLDSTLGSTEGG